MERNEGLLLMNIERKLVSVRACSGIEPIEGANTVELARIDGWRCVVKKGTFKPGDVGYFFEIDSFVPKEPPFSGFMGDATKHANGSEGYKIRTRKFCGEISQGLFLPLSEVSQESLAKVKHYERAPDFHIQGDAVGLFPTFIPKTDLENIQNIGGFSSEELDSEYEVTYKLDGTSCTFFHVDGVFGVCSRNLELKNDGKHIYSQMAKKYVIQESLERCGVNIALQGEIVGPKLQGNPEGVSDYTYHVFDIWDIQRGTYLGTKDKARILDDFYTSDEGLKVLSVSALSFGRLSSYCPVDYMFTLANGSSCLNPLKKREGVVFKPYETVDRQRVRSFKVKSINQLLAMKS